MGRVIATTAMTVDGVMSVEDWFVLEGDHSDASLAMFDGAAMLLGRKNYEGLASFWPSQEGPWAERMNAIRKFVASRTLEPPLEWNATLLEGELADAVARLKAEHEGDLITPGAGELVRGLLAAGLVDELRFGLHPAVWGEGERPFQHEERFRMRLLGAHAYDSGVVELRYAPVAA